MGHFRHEKTTPKGMVFTDDLFWLDLRRQKPVV
jgi:hypothetical protein